MFFVEMEAGLMKKVWSENRSLTVISGSVSLFIGASPGENVQAECPDTATRGRRFPVLSPGAEYPSNATAICTHLEVNILLMAHIVQKLYLKYQGYPGGWIPFPLRLSTVFI